MSVFPNHKVAPSTEGMEPGAVIKPKGGGNDQAVAMVVDRLRLLVKDHRNVDVPKVTGGALLSRARDEGRGTRNWRHVRICFVQAMLSC